MIEIGNGTVGKSEFVWRENELVGPAIECLHHTIGAYGCLSGLHHAGTDGTNTMPLSLGSVHQVASLLRDNHLL